MIQPTILLVRASVIRVVLGAHDLTKDEATQVTISCSESDIITHEEYFSALLKNDIGLVHLSEKVNFTSAIQPINLPSSSDPDLGTGVLLTATGWGLQSDAENATDSATLYEVTNPSITNEECAEVYGPTVTEDTICTDTLPNNQGTCTGDSGGPLNYVVDEKTYSRGITSFVSSEGCEAGLPDGFVRTSHFLDWISEKTGIAIDP
ncbi:Brachyurin [Armadillidium vulgare]|nr:Brachyurin [Armadillidium vulgare]